MAVCVHRQSNLAKWGADKALGLLAGTEEEIASFQRQLPPVRATVAEITEGLDRAEEQLKEAERAAA